MGMPFRDGAKRMMSSPGKALASWTAARAVHTAAGIAHAVAGNKVHGSTLVFTVNVAPYAAPGANASNRTIRVKPFIQRPSSLESSAASEAAASRTPCSVRCCMD
jgi:hypothetical protein